MTLCDVCGLTVEPAPGRGRPRKRHVACSVPCRRSGHPRARPVRITCECGCGPLPAGCRSSRRFATRACQRRVG